MGAYSEESYSLLETDTLSEAQAEALNAVAQKLRSMGYDPAEFRADLNCDERLCRINVYPKELETEEYSGWRGCPLKYCATIVYSMESRVIVEVLGWR